MTLDGSSVVVASGRQTTGDLGPGVVVLNLETNVYYTLQGTAKTIWESIREPVSVEKLVGQLLQRYDADPERCRSEVLRFLEQLVGQGLVEIRQKT